MDKPGKKRTVSELINASEHLYYEIAMFIVTGGLLAKKSVPETSLVNAILESFVIHFRVLCDFFYPEGPTEGDVLADHFFDSPSDWKRPKITTFLRDSRKRADKEVAHLTYDRQDVRPEEKYWKSPEIGKQIISVIKAFLDAVPDGRIGPKCRDLKRHPLFETPATDK